MSVRYYLGLTLVAYTLGKAVPGSRMCLSSAIIRLEDTQEDNADSYLQVPRFSSFGYLLRALLIRRVRERGCRIESGTRGLGNPPIADTRVTPAILRTEQCRCTGSVRPHTSGSLNFYMIQLPVPFKTSGKDIGSCVVPKIEGRYISVLTKIKACVNQADSHAV